MLLPFFDFVRAGGGLWQLEAAGARATVAQEEANAREVELQDKLAAAVADVEAGADAENAHVSVGVPPLPRPPLYAMMGDLSLLI